MNETRIQHAREGLARMEATLAFLHGSIGGTWKRWRRINLLYEKIERRKRWLARVDTWKPPATMVSEKVA